MRRSERRVIPHRARLGLMLFGLGFVASAAVYVVARAGYSAFVPLPASFAAALVLGGMTVVSLVAVWEARR